MKVEVKYNQDTLEMLNKLPDKIMYAVARQTLDRVGSTQITPYKTGNMQRSMYAHGVTRNSYGIYVIGDYVDYATRVYGMPQSTNWTNPKSKAQWFDYFWRNYGTSVVENVVARYKI